MHGGTDVDLAEGVALCAVVHGAGLRDEDALHLLHATLGDIGGRGQGVGQALVVEAEGDAGVAEVWAGVGGAEGATDADAAEVVVCGGEDDVLVAEGEWAVWVAEAADGDGVEALVDGGEEEVEVGAGVEDNGGGGGVGVERYNPDGLPRCFPLSTTLFWLESCAAQAPI